MMRRILLATAFLAFVATPALAQVQECAAYIDLINTVVDGPDDAERQRAITSLTDIVATPRCFARFLISRASPDGKSVFRRFLARFEGERSDKQEGATAAGSGSTTVVAQGATARVLSAAAEYGVLTQASKDGIVTLRGNLAGLPSALVSHDVFPYCVDSDKVNQFCVARSPLSVLRKFSFGVSFDPSRNETLTTETAAPPGEDVQEVTFTASNREIAGFSVRGEIWNHRDTTSETFKKAWREKVGPALDVQSAELLSAGNFIDDIISLPGYDAWRMRNRAVVAAAGRDRKKVVDAVTRALEELSVEVQKMKNSEERLAALYGAYNRFFMASDDLIDALATASVLAVEYTHNIPLAQPSTSNLRVIYDQPFSKKVKLVANFAVTLYDDEPEDPAAGGRFRDVQAGAQLDVGLGDTAIGAAVFSLAGYFQNQRAAAILRVDPATPLSGVIFAGLPEGAKEVFTNTGNIWLAQAKVSLTPAGKSVTVPVSVTYSNRTELVDGPTWRGQIGLSYNVDALFAGLAR